MVRCLLVASLLTLPAGVVLAASPLCATPEQAAKVQPVYAATPALPTFMAAANATRSGCSPG